VAPSDTLQPSLQSTWLATVVLWVRTRGRYLHHYQHSHEFLNCDNNNARQIMLVYLRQFEFPKALFNAILG